ncbi:MAG: DedA family protein [Parcubacteria group bacterium]
MDIGIIDAVVDWGTTMTETWGYLGIFITQSLESVMIPIPSEVVLPLGGFMSSIGEMNLWMLILVATLANLVGSIVAYVIGVKGGRPILERYGKYVLITHHEIERMENLLEHHGRKVAFIARLLPGIRTFSSLIIGSVRMRFWTFFWYTLAGSVIWNGVLAYIGFALGEQWEDIHIYFRKFEIVILVLVVIAVAWFIIHRIRIIRKEENK